MMNLILASASPRRRALLANLGVAFTVKPSPMDKKALALSGPPARQAVDAAKAKAAAAAAADPDSWILAADTLVYIDGRILGKPTDIEDARRMLRLLAGNCHQVTTGICLCHAGRVSPPAVFEETKVWMAPLSAAQIDGYLAMGESMDKAGAYGIQSFGGALIPRVEGCYFNVMGLPLYRTACLLEKAGFALNPPAGKVGAYA